MADQKANFSSTVSDSISQPKILLTQIFQRLKLKEESFLVSNPASSEMIDEMWSVLQTVDHSIIASETLKKGSLQSKPQLKAFLDHCCVLRKYMFQIKKCGSSACAICGPPCLPPEKFNQIKFLPDPMPGEAGHYKSFSEVYGTKTTEAHCPSAAKTAKRRKTLPFSSNLRHVKNVDMMLQCEECESWRLLYSQKRLALKERTELEKALDDFVYSCGASLQDLDLPGKLGDVYVRDVTCGDPIEKLYYTAKYPPICVYCASSVEPAQDTDYLPQCTDCTGPHINFYNYCLFIQDRGYNK